MKKPKTDGWKPSVNREFCKSLIGMSREDATKVIEAKKLRARVTRVDGTFFIVTMDYRLDRINLHIENNKVVHASVG